MLHTGKPSNYCLFNYCILFGTGILFSMKAVTIPHHFREKTELAGTDLYQVGRAEIHLVRWTKSGIFRMPVYVRTDYVTIQWELLAINMLRDHSIGSSMSMQY